MRPPVPDFENPRRGPALIEAVGDAQGVRLRWADGRVDQVNALWLRENAAEPHTTHPVSREPLLPLLDIPGALWAKGVEVPEGGDRLVIRWSHDQGTCTYRADWLRHRLDALRPGAPEAGIPPRQLWRARADLPRHRWPAIDEDRAARLAWMRDLYVFGAAVVTDAPADAAVLDGLCAHIGPIWVSNFGRVFDVRIEADIRSNASTGIALPVHTDLCTRTHVPSLQLLQCMENSATGGESLLVDGFELIGQIERAHPAVYETLATVPFTFASRAPDTDFRYTGPMIERDHHGALHTVRLSPWLRYGVVGDAEQTAAGYAALRTLLRMSAEPERGVKLRLEPGDVLCFDNVRMLHGRTALGAGATRRWLRGCYLDRDDLISHLRMAWRDGIDLA